MNRKAQIVQTLVVTAVVAIASAVLRSAQDPLSAAKDLYASAAYEDALSTLSRINADGAAPDLSRQVDEYRAFCLYALGRTREAETVAETLIRRQPLATLDAADASPRLESMFSDVRKRLLPSLIREQFRSARLAIDDKSYGAAEPRLTDARQMIREAQRLGVKDDGLADLSVLVDGFLGLIQSAADQRAAQPAPVAVVASTAATAPAQRSSVASPGAPSRPVAAASSPESRPSAAARAADAGLTHTIDDEGVTPPLTIQQRMPAMPTQLQTITRAVHARGLLDVVIDETGRVTDARIRQSLNAAFDSLVVRSARDWKYQPATKDGVPVRFVKTILLVP
jgi:TonB family protein